MAVTITYQHTTVISTYTAIFIDINGRIFIMDTGSIHNDGRSMDCDAIIETSTLKLGFLLDDAIGYDDILINQFVFDLWPALCLYTLVDAT